MSEEVEKAWEGMENAHWHVIIKNMIIILKSLQAQIKLMENRLKALEDRVKE